MDVKIGPWKPRDPKPNLKFRRNQKGQFRRAWDPDAMEVDATAIDASTASQRSDASSAIMKGISRRTATNSRHSRRRREVHLLRKPRPERSQLKKTKKKEMRFPLLIIQTHLWFTSRI